MTWIASAVLVIAHTPAGDRYAYAGQPLSDDVDETELTRLAEAGLIVRVADPTPGDEPSWAPEPAEPVDLDAMTVAELIEYAAVADIDLGGATRKADIIAAIRHVEGE